ncbi:hypothetical protein, partial [Dokdonella sp.]|uniref:hypothetical protein n=1 Tax=Dokdonella sp. TaxID=2291710 RepID=UPI002F42E5FA
IRDRRNQGSMVSQHRAGPATFYLRRNGRLEVHVNGMVLAIVPAEDVARHMSDGERGLGHLTDDVAAALPRSLDIDIGPVRTWLGEWQLRKYLAD